MQKVATTIKKVILGGLTSEPFVSVGSTAQSLVLVVIDDGQVVPNGKGLVMEATIVGITSNHHLLVSTMVSTPFFDKIFCVAIQVLSSRSSIYDIDRSSCVSIC